MRGKAGRGTSGIPPRVSASPGTIKKYMTQEGVKESPGTSSGTKNKATESPQKKGSKKQLVASDNAAGGSSTPLDESIMETRQKKQLPTKDEMAEMFAKLEMSIKGEIATLHEGMNHLLQRVEVTEESLTTQGEEIKRLKAQMDEMQRDQRNLMYKIEDQENRSRRKKPED